MINKAWVWDQESTSVPCNLPRAAAWKKIRINGYWRVQCQGSAALLEREREKKKKKKTDPQKIVDVNTCMVSQQFCLGKWTKTVVINFGGMILTQNFIKVELENIYVPLNEMYLLYTI